MVNTALQIQRRRIEDGGVSIGTPEKIASVIPNVTGTISGSISFDQPPSSRNPREIIARGIAETPLEVAQQRASEAIGAEIV